MKFAEILLVLNVFIFFLKLLVVLYHLKIIKIKTIRYGNIPNPPELAIRPYHFYWKELTYRGTDKQYMADYFVQFTSCTEFRNPRSSSS